jgi:DNA-binding PadR family transcriptional regulator
MFRRPEQLTALEEDALAVLRAHAEAHPAGWRHPWGIATDLEDLYGKSLARNGTLYRCLTQLETKRAVISRTEDDFEARAHRGPARRLYRITQTGLEALETQGSRRRNATKAPALAKIRTRTAPTPT